MKDNARFISLILFFVIAAGLLWFVVSDDSPESDEPTTSPQARAPRQPDSQPDTASDASRSSIPRESTTAITSGPARESAFEPRQPQARRGRGAGKITGEVTAETMAMPSDITIALYKVGWKRHEGPPDDALLEEIPLNADHTFEFDRLPFARYAVRAHAAGATAQGYATLAKERPEAEVKIDLDPAGTISGAIIDKTGNPIEGAEVYLSRYWDDDSEGQVSEATALYSLARSTEDGSYTIESIADPVDEVDTTWEVTAKAEGYARSTREKVPVGTANVDLVLTKGGTVSGHVVHADSGDPVPNIQLAVAGADRLGGDNAISSKDGSFTITGISPGDHTLSVIHDELVPTEIPIEFTVTDEAETAGVRVTIARGGTISGRVYDADTKKGISGETVRAIQQSGGGSGRLEAKTDVTGRYTITGLRSGGYSVRRPNVFGYPRDTGRGDDARLVTAKVSQDTTGIDFPLERGLYIEGVVVDQDDNPVSGAQTYAQSRMGGSRQYATTRGDGAFVLAGLSPGAEYTVRATKEGLAATPVGPFTLFEEGIDDLRIVMGPPSSIEGVIVDLNGNPVPEARAYASEQTSGQGQTSTKADQFGQFKITSLSAGTYSFQLSGPGGNSYRQSITENPTVALGDQETVTGIRLIFDQDSGLSIAGRVTDATGEPLDNVHLNANGRGVGGGSWGSGQTDELGRFKIAGLKEGAHSITTSSNDHTNQTLEDILAGDQNVNIVLRGRGTVEGQVIDANTRQPIQGFSIYNYRGNQNFQPWMSQNFRAMYDDQGHFTLDSVEEGDAMIVAKAEGYAQGTTPVSNVVAGQTKSGIVIALEPGAVLEGVVIDTAGQPIANAMIFAGAVPQEYQRQGSVLDHTSRDGSFSLESLPSDTTTISAHHASFAPSSVPVNLSSGGGGQIEIVMGRGGMVEGVVTHGGQPVEGQQVYIYFLTGGAMGNNNRAQTDANGFFSLAGLPEGNATVISNLMLGGQPGQRGRSRQVQVSVADESITTVNIDFTLGTGSIEGTVYADENTPLAEANINASIISAIDGTTENFNARTNADGFYLLDGLPEGTVNLGTYVPGHSQKMVSVELGAGEHLRKDIMLSGGGTITVEFANVPQDIQQLQAIALRGEHDIPAFSLEAMMELQQHMATAAQAQDGIAILEGLEPGTYTILAFAVPNFDATSQADIEEIYARMSVTSDIVTIEEEDQRINLTLAF